MVGIKDFEMPSCCNSCSHWSFNRDDEPLCDLTYEYIRQFNKRQDDCPLVETYTKADMVAMLEKLKLEIKELWDSRYDVWLDNQYYIGKSDTLEEVDEVIQQKIDALKVVSEPQESEDNNA